MKQLQTRLKECLEFYASAFYLRSKSDESFTNTTVELKQTGVYLDTPWKNEEGDVLQIENGNHASQMLKEIFEPDHDRRNAPKETPEGFTHIDYWLEDHMFIKDENLRHAAFCFEIWRMPAYKYYNFDSLPWLENLRLFCDYEGARYRVVGASSMGDVWLTSKFQNTQYEQRVDVAKCSNWSPHAHPTFHVIPDFFKSTVFQCASARNVDLEDTMAYVTESGSKGISKVIAHDDLFGKMYAPNTYVVFESVTRGSVATVEFKEHSIVFTAGQVK